jgi:hypothetical protein
MEEVVLELPEMLKRAGFSKRDVEKVKLVFEAERLSREIRERGKGNVKGKD